jgi:hypothetical protein
MQVIPLAFFLVMLELAVGSHLVLYALDVRNVARNDTSFNFFRFQAILYLVLFSLLAWATQNGFATPHQLMLDGFNLDYGWLSHQQFTLGWFLIAQVAYFISMTSPTWRTARLVTGGLATAFGVACLFSVGMGVRTIAAAHLGGAFTVAAFMLGALALGGVSTAMLLGHWYLNTPTASGKPLEFATMLTLGGIAFQIVCGLLSGPVTYVAPRATAHAAITPTAHVQPATTTTPTVTSTTGATTTATTTVPTPSVPHGVIFPTLVLILLEYLLGLGVPLALGGISLHLERDRSFQSATGMLYIAVVFTFFGEILARGLFLQPLT